MSYEEARQFLARVVPWPCPEGYVNIHYTFQGAGYTRPTWRGKACQTIDQAIGEIHYRLGRDDTQNIYVCMSLQRTAEEEEHNGRKFLSAIRSQEHALSLKSLFLDIDFKDFPANDAVIKLRDFLDATSLPVPSIVVKSGGGIHAHWTVNRALTVLEWQPLANALAEATKKHSFKCDTHCTIDAARVLRIPDTLNRKETLPRKVTFGRAPLEFDYTVECMDGVLDPYKVAARKYTNGHAINSELSAGVHENGGMTQHDMHESLAVIPNDGRDWDGWNSMGMRCFLGSNGADWALGEWQEWSNKNSNYEINTGCQDRWEYWLKAPPNRTGSGAIIEEARRAVGDPHWQPPPAHVINLPVPAPNDMPDGYRRNTLGIVECDTPLKDGARRYIAICSYSMLEPFLQRYPDKTLNFYSHIEDRKQLISIEHEHVNSSEMRRILQKQGLMVPASAKGAENIGKFFVAWIEHLQKTKGSVYSSPFGWSMNKRTGVPEGFVYNGTMWTTGASQPAASPDPVIARQYIPTGDIAPWREAANLITAQGRPQLDAILAASFGAPLVRFTGHQGLQLSTYSAESGIGKTTALKVAQAVWGDPVKGLQGLSDTKNFVMYKIGELQSLPLFWDELKTDEQAKKFVEITFEVTGGREKARLHQNVTARESGSWQTLVISASNDSLLDHVLQYTKTTTAGLYRIFEYEVERGVVGQISTAEAQRIIARLNDNYGAVGLEYAKFLGANISRLDQEVGHYASAIERETQALSDERLWTAMIAVLVMGAKYANELSLTNINVDNLKEFLFSVLERMRKTRVAQPVDMKNSLDVSNILAQFLNEMAARYTIHTKNIFVGLGRPPKTKVKLISPIPIETLQGINVQFGQDDDLLHISRTQFHRWLAKWNYPQTIVVTALEQKFDMKTIRGRLGAGVEQVPDVGLAEYLYQFKRTDPELAKCLV